MFITKSLTKAFKFTTHLELEVNLNKWKEKWTADTNMKCFVTTRLFAHHKAHFLKLKMEAISSPLAPAGTDVAAPAATVPLSGCHFPEPIPPTPMKQNSQKRCVWFARKTKGERRCWYQCGLPWEARTLCCTMFLAVPHTTWPQQPLNFVFFIINKDCLQLFWRKIHCLTINSRWLPA